MPKKNGLFGKLAKILITAALCGALFGCEGEAQVFVVDLATPSPRPELVAIGDAPIGESYSITVISPAEGEKGTKEQSLQMDTEDVITSYSIHYTKLYERLRTKFFSRPTLTAKGKPSAGIWRRCST